MPGVQINLLDLYKQHENRILIKSLLGLNSHTLKTFKVQPIDILRVMINHYRHEKYYFMQLYHILKQMYLNKYRFRMMFACNMFLLVTFWITTLFRESEGPIAIAVFHMAIVISMIMIYWVGFTKISNDCPDTWETLP